MTLQFMASRSPATLARNCKCFCWSRGILKPASNLLERGVATTSKHGFTRRRSAHPITSIRRSYATEATGIPRAVLLRSPAPASPTTQAQHPESASHIDTSVDRYLIDFHRHIRQASSSGSKIECATVPELYEQLASRAARVLEHELAFEDTPQTSRRIMTSTHITNWQDSCDLASKRIEERRVADIEEDGLLLIAHVIDAPEAVTSWSLGFLIETIDRQNYVISCSHTLESATHSFRTQAASSSSSSLIVTRSGFVLPITSIATSLPLHDIVVYSFSQTPANVPIPPKAARDGMKLRSVPIALHPPQINTDGQVFMVGNDEWRKCKVIGYRDPRGNEAEPGTYDELNSLNIDLLPSPGSSGGPLVSTAGAVTALIRGSRMSFGERRSTGFATPAEKLFELFQLPGLGKKDGPAGAGFINHH